MADAPRSVPRDRDVRGYPRGGHGAQRTVDGDGGEAAAVPYWRRGPAAGVAHGYVSAISILFFPLHSVLSYFLSLSSPLYFLLFLSSFANPHAQIGIRRYSFSVCHIMPRVNSYIIHQPSTFTHISPLYGLYPSNQIGPFINTTLSAAAQQLLIFRGEVLAGWCVYYYITSPIVCIIIYH